MQAITRIRGTTLTQYTHDQDKKQSMETTWSVGWLLHRIFFLTPRMLEGKP